jgi:hypothetical protein
MAAGSSPCGVSPPGGSVAVVRSPLTLRGEQGFAACGGRCGGVPADSVTAMSYGKNVPRLWRRGALLAAAALLALLTAACSGGGHPAAASHRASPAATSPAQLAVAYAQCMRKHGVTSFPDPTVNSNGGNTSISSNFNPKGVNQATLQSAQSACRKLSPQNAGPPGANSPQNIKREVTWAACIRKHGVPAFPDPSSNGTFNVGPSVNVQGSQFQAATRACQSVRPPFLAINRGRSS